MEKAAVYTALYNTKQSIFIYTTEKLTSFTEAHLKHEGENSRIKLIFPLFFLVFPQGICLMINGGGVGHYAPCMLRKRAMRIK